MQMDDIKEKTADMADHVQDLADTFYKLTVANLTQRISNIGSSLIVGILVGVLVFFVLLFMGIALALWLGDLLHSRTGGFLAGAAFFLLVVLIMGSMRKKLIFPFIRNLIIRKIYD
jgi:hypothetical protein